MIARVAILQPGSQVTSMDRLWARISVLALTLTAILCAFFAVVRPWYLQWGASDIEGRMTLPGDEIIPRAAQQETRAITIDAGVDAVWPWLAQVGQDRGGFYSFDLLENVVGCRMPTVDVLRPDKQSWSPGDKLWMYPPEGAGGAGFATLRWYVPGRALGFGTRMVGTPITAPEDGSWTFVLQPLDGYTTRLLIRGRGPVTRSWLGLAFDRSIFEPVHFAMERRMMIGIKQLAEGQDRARAINHLQVALWTITFGLFIVSGAQVLLRREWRRPLTGFVAAAAVFQVLTFVQPPIMLGAGLVAAVVATLWWRGDWGIFPGAERSSASGGSPPNTMSKVAASH
jgi:hypothetical protein